MGEMKYDQREGQHLVREWECAASVVFKLLSGKFVTYSGGRISIAGSGDNQIIGWAEAGEFTASATAGASKVDVNMAWDAIYELPIDATATEAELLAIRGKTCDLVINTYIQQADIGESNEDVIQIVDYDADKQTVYVKMNPYPANAPTGVA